MAAPATPKAPARTPIPQQPPAAKETPEAEAPEVEAAEVDAKPVVERVNIAGLVIEKTVYPDGECETEVLREPEIDPQLVRATRNNQRRRGH
jgi:hypothetical protein